MHYDIQKPGVLRRFIAALFDGILLLVLICGIAWGVSAIMNFDEQLDAMNSVYEKYETEYGIDFTITEEAMATMPEDELAKYNEAIEAMNNDESAYFIYIEVLNSFLIIASISILLSHFLLEFLVPVLLKNGQTLGKKVFGIALMRKDGVMVTNFAMFVRSILGKSTIETMVPVMVVFMMFLGLIGEIGTIILLALLIAQVALLFLHPQGAVLHDLLSGTVAVDMSSQLIFTSAEAMLDYQKQRAAEKAERADY